MLFTRCPSARISASRFLDAFIGGGDRGGYFTPTYSGFDPSNTNSFGPSSSFIARPDVIGNPGLSSGQSITNWFNAGAFAIPGCPASTPVCAKPAPVGRFGNAGVNILQGPGVINWDWRSPSFSWFVSEYASSSAH
jgi:hypothetical protein